MAAETGQQRRDQVFHAANAIDYNCDRALSSKVPNKMGFLVSSKTTIAWMIANIYHCIGVWSL
jgi:hypothetical protein